MTTRRQVLRALDKIDATLDDVGEGIYVIDSPPGMLWHTDTHSIQVQWQSIHESISDVWRDLLDDIQQGIHPCNGWQDGLIEFGTCERCYLDDCTTDRSTP